MSLEDTYEKEFKKIEELVPRSRGIDVVARVVSKSDVREVHSRRDYSTHRVCDALVGDETASVILTLWDDIIEEIDVGDTITIKNGYTSLFRGSLRLNIGRYGSYEKTEEPVIDEVNTENNLSDRVYERPRRYPTFRSMYSDRGYRRGRRRRY